MNRRVLLTGATGFVGANLARRLLQEGHDVHLLVRPGYAAWRIKEIRPHVRLHSAPLTHPTLIQRSVKKIRPDWIFHLAAYGAYSSQNDAPAMIQTNILGMNTLLEACIHNGFEAFVNTGSSSEYGYQPHAPSEADIPEPNSLYAVTKLSATQLCRYVARKHKLHIPTLRLYSVYGPYEEPTRLIPTLLVRGLKGKLPPLVDPRIARDFIFVEDVIEAYLQAASKKSREWGAIYNVGTGVQTSLRQVVEVVRKLLPIEQKPRWSTMPNRSWDTRTWVANSRKIQSQLHWSAKTSFKQGLVETLEWLRKHPAWLQHYQRAIR